MNQEVTMLQRLVISYMEAVIEPRFNGTSYDAAELFIEKNYPMYQSYLALRLAPTSGITN